MCTTFTVYIDIGALQYCYIDVVNLPDCTVEGTPISPVFYLVFCRFYELYSEYRQENNTVATD